MPLPYLTHLLILAAYKVHHGTVWYLPEYRTEIITDIDRAARLLETKLFPQVRTRDHTIYLWRQRQARKVANALRLRESWLITPASSTREKLTQELCIILVALLTGEWDRMPLEETPVVTWAQRYSSFLVFGRGLVTAALPITLLMLIHHSGLVTIELSVRDYVNGLLILWATLSLISTFDPCWREIVSATKDIVSIFPGSRKG